MLYLNHGMKVQEDIQIYLQVQMVVLGYIEIMMLIKQNGQQEVLETDHQDL